MLSNDNTCGNRIKGAEVQLVAVAFRFQKNARCQGKGAQECQHTFQEDHGSGWHDPIDEQSFRPSCESMKATGTVNLEGQTANWH
jgi:hypothetical protein